MGSMGVSKKQKKGRMPMDDFLTRTEHNEFAKRMEEEHNRQNHRIHELEESQKQIYDLTISVREQTISVKNLTEELKEQREKIRKIEAQPADKWNSMTKTIITSVVSTFAGALVSGVIILLSMTLK